MTGHGKVTSNGDLFLHLDDNQPSGNGGANSLKVLNGADVTVFEVEENGDATIPSGTLVVGGVVCATNVLCISDRRFKTNISPLNNSLAKLSLLKGVSYNWNQEDFPTRSFNNRGQIGLIAQDVEGIFPEIVNTDELGFKSVDYASLIPILIESIKSLDKENS